MQDLVILIGVVALVGIAIILAFNSDSNPPDEYL